MKKKLRVMVLLLVATLAVTLGAPAMKAWAEDDGGEIGADNLIDPEGKVKGGGGSGNSAPAANGTNTTASNNWLNEGEANNQVYHGVQNGQAVYTGITKQSIDARLAQHNNAGKGFSRLDVQCEGLTRNQARAVEQYYIENGPSQLNQINSISPNSAYYQDAMS